MTRRPALRQVLLDSGSVARKPPAVRLLSLLLKGDLSAVLSAGAETVQPLAAALNDPDPLLAERARQCLPALQDPDAIQELCAIWVKERTPELERVILQARYLPERPGEVRLLVALKLGRIDVAGAVSPQWVDTLLGACQDADPAIQENAWKAILQVSQDCKDALCQKVIDTEDPLALRVCLAGRFLPHLPEKCAAYLFVSEQWAEYKAFDFDQHLLRLLVETSPPEFRQRIARKIQSSGQTEFLTILSRATLDDGSRPLSSQDVELFLRLLSDNRDYPRIWELVPQVTPEYASRALKILAASRWQPDQPDTLDLFIRLCGLLEKTIEFDPPILATILPFAIPVGTVRAPGRINSIAFDPHSPHLAVGTGQGVVVLWNYQQAKIHRVLRSFKHSIGQLLFMPGGELICAEKTSAKAVCQVYSVRDGQLRTLGSHTGSVTSVAAMGEERILTAGRDGKIKILELAGRDPLAETQVPIWPRSVSTNPTCSLVALLADPVTFLSLPQLEPATDPPYKRLRMTGQPSSLARAGCFSPDGAYLITVQYNGHIGVYAAQNAEKIHHSALAGQDGHVSQAAFLPDRPILLLGEMNGVVNCRAWPSLGLVSSFRAPSARLTSMQVSPDGAFIATGNDESSVTLWDLRLSCLPELVTRPLSSLTSSDMTWIGSLMRLPGLPEQGADLLQFIWAVLQYRFRYDIQLEEAVSIRPGDFDILLG